MTNEIPQEFVDAAGESFTPEGVRQAWHASWRTLGGLSPCELWPKQKERVLAAVESMNQGDFV
jgi:hypothetical protein